MLKIWSYRSFECIKFWWQVRVSTGI